MLIEVHINRFGSSMVSVLASDSSPGRGHCVMLSVNTLYYRSTSQSLPVARSLNEYR